MRNWHITYLGLRELPADLTDFELAYFFSLQRQNAVGLMVRGVSDDDVGRDSWQRQRLGGSSPHS